jgi:hypothetical protein
LRPEFAEASASEREFPCGDEFLPEFNELDEQVAGACVAKTKAAEALVTAIETAINDGEFVLID